MNRAEIVLPNLIYYTFRYTLGCFLPFFKASQPKQSLSTNDFVKWLQRQGFEPAQIIENKGEIKG